MPINENYLFELLEKRKMLTSLMQSLSVRHRGLNENTARKERSIIEAGKTLHRIENACHKLEVIPPIEILMLLNLTHKQYDIIHQEITEEYLRIAAMYNKAKTDIYKVNELIYEEILYNGKRVENGTGTSHNLILKASNAELEELLRKPNLYIYKL